MRILLLTHNVAGQGGSYQRAWGLGRALAARGHETILLAARVRPGMRSVEGDDQGLRVWQAPDVFPLRVRHGGLSPFDVVGRVIKTLRWRPDVVHSFDHRPACSLPALAAHRRGRSVWVADWADRWDFDGIAGERGPLARVSLGWMDHLAERRLYPHADAVTVASREAGERARAFGVEEEALAWIPPGANPDLIRPQAKERARASLGIPPSAEVVVHLGFADYDEDLLGRAFATLAARRPSALLLTSGKSGRALTQVLREAGLASRWIATGSIPYQELGTLLACGDVFLLAFRDRPLNRGRFPNKLGDYLAAGRPVVANPTGDLGDLLREEGFGLLADETPEAMAAAVTQILERPQASAEMGRRARALAEGRLSWTTLAARVERLYAEAQGRSVASTAGG